MLVAYGSYAFSNERNIIYVYWQTNSEIKHEGPFEKQQPDNC